MLCLPSPTSTQNIVLISDAGGATDISNVNLTFDDAAASLLADNTAIASGTFKPTDHNAGIPDVYPAPAPVASSSAPQGTQTLATAFPNSVNPNGVWRLYIVDDAGADTGSLGGGWCVDFTLTNATTTTGVTASTNPIITGQSVTLTANVGVVAPGIGVPTGTVQFQENGLNIGAAQTLNASGVASLTTSALVTAGTRTITAVYTPTGSFNTSSGTLAGGIQVNANATWTGTTNSAWNTGTNWATGFAPGAINGAVIPGGVIPNEPSISGAPDVNISSLSVGAGRILTVGAGGILTVTGACMVTGTMSVAGSFTCGSVVGAGNVNFTGSAPQNVPAGMYQNLGVTNPAGVNLADDVTVDGVLTLAGGNVNAGPNTLTIGPAGSIARTSGFVIGNLEKIFDSTEDFTYLVGTPGEFSPVDVVVTAGTGELTVNAVDGIVPATPALSTNSLQRYWTLTGSGITADVTFHYIDADVVGNEGFYHPVRVTGMTATILPRHPCPGTICVNTTANTIFVGGLSSFSNWSATQLIPTAGEVSVSGHVVTTTGIGLGGALMTLRDVGGNTVTTTTDTSGFYVFEDVPAGATYTLTPQLKAIRLYPAGNCGRGQYGG
jgi:hypothetical protein